MNNVDYMIRAAGLSRNSASLWFRYMGKVITNSAALSPEEAAEIIQSGKLSGFQRVTLKLALRPDTAYHSYVVGLSQEAKIKTIEERLKEYGL